MERRERLGRKHAPDSPFQGWAARPSRRMCVEDGARIKHILIPPLTIYLLPIAKRDDLEGAPHTWVPDLFSGTAAFSEAE